MTYLTFENELTTFLDKSSRILGNVTKTTVDIIGTTNPMSILIGSTVFQINTNQTITVATALDVGSIAAGKDYYIYACNSSGSLVFVVSLNSTFPSGYSATTSRKIGGFHTLCVDVGTIVGHPLSGYVANNILPQSVWDLRFRTMNGNNAGLVFDNTYSQKWVGIYLVSDNGSGGVQSVYNATHLVSVTWSDFVDKCATVGVRLLEDDEFQEIAEGSNQQTNIAGSADVTVVGGHSDTAGRRMISNIGCEECAGYLFQWLRTQSYGAAGTVGGENIGYYLNSSNGSKGQLYIQGTYGDIKLVAGGYWNAGGQCGSRSRTTLNQRWLSISYIGARFAAGPV